MTIDTPQIDRVMPAVRPRRWPAGYQCWSDLLFVHWRVPASELVPLLPPELTLDLYEGEAWVGLVPFHMAGVRPWWSPSVPGISEFHETNVRTYVHWQGRDPGVWFLSLDAANALACRLARWGWHLPYHHARMDVQRDGCRVRYASTRNESAQRAMLQIEANIGSPLPSLRQDMPPGQATPGTLEHFLAERYLLYARSPRGRIYQGQVHHTPYPLREATIVDFQETLLAANGIPRAAQPCHVLFSDGVQVEVFGLRAVEG